MAENRTRPDRRIIVLTLGMAAAAVFILSFADLPGIPANSRFAWWLLIPAFFLTDVLVIHLPTKRSAHTVSVAEFPMVIGLAFVAPALLIVAWVAGSVAAFVGVRRQAPIKLAFNTSLLLLEATAVVSVYHAILQDGSPIEPRGWVAASVAIIVSSSLSALLVSLAISTYDHEDSIVERSRELTAGLLISMFAGLVAILWVIVLWHEPLAGILLGVTAVPVFAALRVYERLARRHDELGIAHALTKELDDHDAVRLVAEAGLARVVESLNPAAAVVLVPGEEPITYFEAVGEEFYVGSNWDETIRYHRDVCVDGGVCSCGRRLFGQLWDGGRLYRLVIADSVRGALVIRPRVGRGTEISSSDHGMLEAIAAQLSSAMTRIAAVDQLRSEIAEKQALVRSKDQLIASVSHELRTPLTGIIGFAELLAEGGDELGPAELEHAKRYIANEAHDLGNIVEDLLTAARADLGSLEVQAKPVSTTTVIERAMVHLEDGTIEVAGPDLWLSADAPRVRQILRNLLTNAVKYGGEKIEVSGEPADENVIIRVVDNGDGVADDLVDNIFEPYESAHNEPSQPGSLGLGLSISRTLARLMGGDLSYHRIADHTEFRLTLPALKGASRSEEVSI